MANLLRDIVILIFGNIIVGALLPAIPDDFMRIIFYIGLGIADILAIIAIIRRAAGTKG
jgi:hypothetical protein